MLAEAFTQDTPLPLPGSVGYLRGTAQRCRILRRDADGQCFVQLFRRNKAWQWEPVPGSSGNRTIPEADIYETEKLAVFCGKPPPARRAPPPPGAFTDPPRKQRGSGKPRGRR